ncbi:hypothetical protein [Paracoccus sediminilitoris]|uniref:hypothetical protein n=1 Tax=Paracoccus sediminilitoris TaxID=2202419 RepID=UPI003FA6855D
MKSGTAEAIAIAQPTIGITTVALMPDLLRMKTAGHVFRADHGTDPNEKRWDDWGPPRVDRTW